VDAECSFETRNIQSISCDTKQQRYSDLKHLKAPAGMNIKTPEDIFEVTSILVHNDTFQREQKQTNPKKQVTLQALKH
jgi:hypothetical protein